MGAGTPRILVVDDEVNICRTCVKILSRRGYLVDYDLNGYDALRRLAAESFDVVVTDMTMPYLTGDQLAKELLSIRPDIRIIVCTGFSERLDREKAAAMGIRGFLMKPILRSDLGEMVRKVLDEAGSGAQV